MCYVISKYVVILAEINKSVMEEPVLKIDLEKVIGNKNPRLLKILPRFVINYLKKIVHQNEINKFFEKSHGKKGLDFVDAVLENWDMKIEVFGEENIPDSGRFVFVANHPIGGIESMAFMKVISRKFPDIKFPVNDILMELKPMNTVFIPINKHGAQSKAAIREFDECFAGDKQVLYFPAGICSRRVKGKIIDLEWKKTVIAKAVQHKRDVVPVFIDGRNSNFFYNLANTRKFLGVKSNLEMLYLVDETFRQFYSTMRLVVGEPVSYQTFTSEKSQQQWSQYMKDKVYSLAVKLPLKS